MGERIAFLRHHLGLTQAELGKRIHVSASTIGMYEQGRRLPSVGILDALANELEVPIDYLVRGSVRARAVTNDYGVFGESSIAEYLEFISKVLKQKV